MTVFSAALYIHIPFCISKCHYCDFFSRGGSDSVSDSYVDSLCQEIRGRAKEFSVKEWGSVYIGGGTPSLLNACQIKQILSAIKEAAVLPENSEITIELNPDDITENLLETLNESRINRISVGIQSFNDEALSFCHRRADSGKNEEGLSLIQKKWKKRFSVDLICGLPFESEESFMSGLEKIVSFNPDHISMYSLTFEDETPFGKLLNQKKIDYDYDFSDALWLKGRDFLENHGFYQYEVSNFAKKGFESLHNLCYWNHKSYLGCGSGATGTVYNEDGSALRLTNTTNIEEYIKNPLASFTGEEIDVKTSVLEFFMMGLRKLGGVSEKDFYNSFGKKLIIPDSVKKLAKEWERKGLCKINESEGDYSFTLGKEGILYLNRFIFELLDLELE